MTRFGDLTPIRATLEDIKALEKSASSLRAQPQQETLRDVRIKLENAIAEAEQPQLADGLTVEEVAQLQGVTPQAIRKRIKNDQVPGARRMPGGWRIPREYIQDVA